MNIIDNTKKKVFKNTLQRIIEYRECLKKEKYTDSCFTYMYTTIYKFEHYCELHNSEKSYL